MLCNALDITHSSLEPAGTREKFEAEKAVLEGVERGDGLLFHGGVLGKRKDGKTQPTCRRPCRMVDCRSCLERHYPTLRAQSQLMHGVLVSLGNLTALSGGEITRKGWIAILRSCKLEELFLRGLRPQAPALRLRACTT